MHQEHARFEGSDWSPNDSRVHPLPRLTPDQRERFEKWRDNERQQDEADRKKRWKQ